MANGVAGRSRIYFLRCQHRANKFFATAFSVPYRYSDSFPTTKSKFEKIVIIEIELNNTDPDPAFLRNPDPDPDPS
jgi:hypothetical protein